MSKKTPFKFLIFHLLAIVALFVVIVLGFFQVYLPLATKHGQEVLVPDIQGKTINEIDNILTEKKVRVFVSDSVFAPDVKPMTVMSQYPKPMTLVKENRKIYVTVSSTKPPLIKMPKLLDASLQNAQLVLQSYGLKLGNVTKVPHYAENAVLKQSYQGKEIKQGDLIGKGSAIDLVVGNGVSDVYIPVPNLIGMNADEAMALIESLGLDVGSVNYDPNSAQSTGTVIRQKPKFEEGDSIRQGQSIDIWLAGKNRNALISE
ncbi:MAG: PASTA domain-containing protein [Cytophagales bacterium]